MRSLKGRIIIEADLEQKSVIKFGTLTLFMPPKQELLTPDGKVGNPVLAKIISADPSYEHLKVGDVILLSHNTILNPALRVKTDQGSVVTLVIPRDRFILARFGERGQLIPVCENTLCRRIEQSPISSIIITPDAYKKSEENKVMVLKRSSECRDLNEGQIGIIHRYSDYEANYTLNGKRETAIIVWEKEIVAIAE